MGAALSVCGDDDPLVEHAVTSQFGRGPLGHRRMVPGRQLTLLRGVVVEGDLAAVGEIAPRHDAIPVGVVQRGPGPLDRHSRCVLASTVCTTTTTIRKPPDTTAWYDEFRLPTWLMMF